MNVSEFSDDDNATSFHNQSTCEGRDGYRLSDAVITTHDIIRYACITVGIPGNILSAIVWLRRRKTSSAVYLAALAITDLVYLLTHILQSIMLRRDVLCGDLRSWLCLGTLGFVAMFSVAIYAVGCVWELSSCVTFYGSSHPPLNLFLFSASPLND